MQYIDSHLHLQDKRFGDKLETVLDRARQVGVTRFICNGSRESDWPKVLELAKTYKGITPCFGLHPWFVSDASERWLETLEQFLTAIPSGVGEIGLDRWIEPRDEAAQEKVFIAQLELARRLERPVVIHCLKASDWLLEILQNTPQLPKGFHLHAFNGPVGIIGELAEMGAYFSVAGDIFRRNRKKAHALLAAIPENRLLTETDSPNIPPPTELQANKLRDADGKPMSEPADLVKTTAALFSLRTGDENAPEDAVAAFAEKLYENGRRFFGEIW